ncbi:type I polyketide synthase [Nocardia terpenica]|uniref:SDR family NAD(P)-dependent oxidoreductase n=1 Tax=Nocardia terpenica TaxID=455432 RepID=A0A6G9ZE02_9NOCA|nr:type I polyketide synthase [Nocardia terpenica]QIS23768.1 SDR family NAD(P)-dependent oxidoreductase [Nocardia terpenica]
MTAPAPEPPSVSIIGIGCRVPGAAGVEQFWDVLLEGRDARAAAAEGERARLEPNGLHAFDNGFFGISDRDAAAMDPRERMCLEVAVEALDDAGVGHRVRGSRTAVIVAVGGEHRIAAGQAGAPGGLAERLSVALDLRGPLAILDGGCSSSLAAVAATVRALAADEAELAIVGGVNLALPPYFSIDEPAFDPRAVETVDACHRDDGCAVLILQRTADAHREGNRIYADIAGVAVGSADRPGLLAADGQQVVRTAWARAGFAPRDAGLFECHGNGPLFAEPSIDAVAAVLAQDRDPADKTWIGSATSAVGRLGAAAAITGIAKAALCIRHGIIAPTAGFPDRRPRLGEFGLHVPTEPIGWQDVPLPDRRAGINSSGCGTAAHLVLRGPTRTTPPRATDPPFLLPLSARDETELRARAAHWATLLSESPAPLREFATTASRLLPQQTRSTIIAWNIPDAITRLCSLADPLSPCTTAIPQDPAALTHAPASPKPTDNPHTPRTKTNPNSPTAMPRARATREPDGGTHTPSANTDPTGPATVTRAPATREPNDDTRIPRTKTDPTASAATPRTPATPRPTDNTHTPRAKTDPNSPAAVTRAQETRESDGGTCAPGANTGPTDSAAVTRARATREPNGSSRMPRTKIGPTGSVATSRAWGTQVSGGDGCSPCGDVGSTGSVGSAHVVAVRGVRDSGGGVLFLFSSEGGEYSRMGRGLAARYPVFARGVAEGADAVVRAGGPRVWTPRHGFGHGLDCAEVVQPALFVYQVALAELLGAWGIRPDAVAGYGLGEVAAAVVSGALSLSAGARVAVARGRALARVDGPVATAVLAVSPEQARRLVEPLRAEVSIAAIHGAESVVVAGVPNYVETVLRRAGRRGMSWHRVADDPAAYGPGVRAVRHEFTTVLGDLDARTAERRLYSTTLGRPLDDRERVDAGYWADNLCGAVDVASALDSAAADGISTAVEISPRAVLATLVRQHSSFHDSAHALTGESEAVAFLDVVAGLYLEGRAVDWAAQGEFTGISLERLWRRSIFPQVDTAAIRLRAKPRPVDIALPDRSPVPTAFWLRRLLWVAAGTRLTDFTVHGRVDAAVLPDVGFRAGSRVLAVFGQVPLASGRIAPAPTPADIVAWLRTVDAHRNHRDPGNHSAIGLFGYVPLDTAAVDACLRLIAAAAADLLPPDRWPFPVGIASAWLDDTAGLLLTEAHAFVRAAHPGELLSDVIAIDQHGAPAVALLGVRSALDTADRGRAPEHAPPQSDIVPPTGVVYRIRETATGYAWDAVDALPDLLPVGEPPRPEARPLLLSETWTPLAVPAASEAHSDAQFQRALVVGASEAAAALGTELGRRLPTERIARDPAAADSLIASLLAERREPTAVVLVWPDGRPEGSVVEQARRALAVLQRIRGSAAATALTVVLPDRDAIAQHAVAGLVRSLRRESPHPTRLIWLAGHDPGPALDLVMNPAGPQEVRIADGRVSARRFEPVAPAESAIGLSANGTYVVTGGLGRLGAIAVRWLLDAGAHDVVVLTRTPRPLPALLAGLEDRIVVVRCDVTDRADLANALDDVRECGSVIRGFVHAAGIRRDADLAATTPDLLTALFQPTLVAAAALLDLTATDPIDVGLLFSSTLGALGGRDQAAYAAAHAALQALARTRACGTICIGWGRTESNPPGAESGSSIAAGTVDPAHGRAVLTEILRHRDPFILAPDDDPTHALDPAPPCRPSGWDESPESRPKACRDQGEPHRHMSQGELYTHAAQGKPHVHLDQGEAHTHPDQGEPHTHLDQGEPYTHAAHGKPHTHANQGEPYRRADQGEPHTHANQGEPHAHPNPPAAQGTSCLHLDHGEVHTHPNQEKSHTHPDQEETRTHRNQEEPYMHPSRGRVQTRLDQAGPGRGGAAHDSLQSGPTHDSFQGGATHDSFQGGATHNSLQSGATHNSLQSGATHNSLQSGATHNSLQGGGVHNSFHGGGAYGVGRSERGGVREGEVVVGAVGRIIRAALAVMLERRVELLDPTADFAALGVSEAQVGELRRTLESRLGLVLGDSDFSEYPTVAALGAELTARMRAAHPLEESP